MKKGFTLAEVLITLAIIGIVAALTIPTVMAKYNQKAQYTQFMKFYNMMQNTMSLASVEESPTSWDYNPSDINEFFDRFIAPNLKIANRGNVNEIFGSNPIKTLSGGNFVTVSDICNVFGGCTDAVLLQDGSTFTIVRGANQDDDNKYFSVLFDTNGLKAPNILGRDQFLMEIGYYTEGAEKKPYFGIRNEETDTTCNPSGPSTVGTVPQGTGCPLKLLKEGKMDY